jgi:YD repeat-containing protein
MLQQALGQNAGRITNTLSRINFFLEENVDERGLITKTQYDAARNPLSITYPDGASTTAMYEANFSLPTKRTDERGTQTLYQYDALGFTLKV